MKVKRGDLGVANSRSIARYITSIPAITWVGMKRPDISLSKD
jgi:hypothetical protein